MEQQVNRIRHTIKLPLGDKEAFTDTRLHVVPYVRMYDQPYCMTEAILYDETEVMELRQASELVHSVYERVMRFVQHELPDITLVQQLGIPMQLVEAARQSEPISGISRQDWIKGPQGWKCIENNADTPTGIPEAAYLAEELIQESNRLWGSMGAGQRLLNPSNELSSQLQQVLVKLLQHYREQGYSGSIVFSAYRDHAEDRANTMYLLKLVQQAGWEAEFCALEDLRVVPGEGLYANDNKVGIWYRLYPLEYLMTDESEDGFPIGRAVLALTVSKQLAVMNPLQSILLQSKAMMALIWALHEHHDELSSTMSTPILTSWERDIIERYIPPTYLNPEPFRAMGSSYVAKSIWGREGKGTAIYDANGACEEIQDERVTKQASIPSEAYIEDNDDQRYYADQPKVYQAYVPMEAVHMESTGNQLSGYLLTGVYVPGGIYGGLLPRVGGRITGDLARFCPAAIQKNSHLMINKEQIEEGESN
ncbi:glutathionylspermidine synthase family protein [Paenibacillus sp. ACRRX]|uniref:glutathionylspermidine synthase family protein n=1 Tax=Paenibacillus sp. ACRRX TaxID=2918206 RepID=UPI001EF55CF4|nr:glutathionylspermidine synthase family protein [Paenibacillus sp. ACRRX]MCG7406249.1 glutathionylspermidine synthase family protein [Paenibacillus sp. ACRRX]